MNEEQLSIWIQELRQRTPEFLACICSGPPNCPVRYSLTGDLLPQRWPLLTGGPAWGLGNSVFALKSLYILGIEAPVIPMLTAHVLSFRISTGELSDPWIRAFSLPFRVLKAVRTRGHLALSNEETARAETRQAICALGLHHTDCPMPPRFLPQSSEEVQSFLEDLDWTQPWHAGSHFSHLAFFLSRSAPEHSSERLTSALKWIDGLQQPDGGWYRGSPSLSQRINGAMKIITGLRAALRVDPGALSILSNSQAKSLVDLALIAANDAHACDNFNVTYVMRWAAHQCGDGYRREEIVAFMYRRLDLYRQHYFPADGGFSFAPGRANRWYYGAPISRARAEPDIHGTTLFLWGLSTIAAYLGGQFAGQLREHDA